MSKIRFEILPPIDRPGEPVFITGNIGALGHWQPERGLRLDWNPPYHTGEIEAETGTHLEYKIARGSWEKEAVDAWGDVPGNFTYEVWLDGARHHTVADWKDRYRGRLTGERIYSRVLAGEREIFIWLPQGYTSQSGQRFPLIVLHDGANVFDPATSRVSGVDWAADEWVNLLSGNGAMPEAIVVGVCHAEGYSEENVTLRDFDLSPEMGATAYTQFIATELLAHMDTHYRTLAMPAARTLGGAGLGGAATFLTALQHPGTFGKFICLSTSFGDLSQSPPESAGLLNTLEAMPELPGGARVYFDYGTLGPDAALGPYHQRLAGLLRTRGWMDGRDYSLERVEGGGHDEISWRWRFGSALRYLAR
jgi:enterochelin esterase-like enzyme